MEQQATFRARLVESVAGIGRDTWDACASSDGAPYNPFLDWRFLDALERSGSIGGRSGWSPAHVILEDSAGEIAGVAPTYVKRHSQGEYVFDHAFADAYQRAGGEYYPKLQVAAPFTPATGPRLLAAPGYGAPAKGALATALLAVRDRMEVSSVHVTFCTEEEQALLVERGYLSRVDRQFHWTNEGYGSYDDFLGDLASRKRKQLKRERREAAEGVVIRQLTGADLTEVYWDAFFEFYMDTGARKWGRPYLNRRFFSMVGEAMPEKILLVVAEVAGKPVAGALNFIGGDALYGRYWGAVEERPFLHFELCYHQAIDAAIERGLSRVEAGAQGEHKLARGYRPVTTYSAHAFADPGLHDAVGDYLARERRMVAMGDEALDAATPFRKDGEHIS
ncbi:GNAT family N-acetyltransferase [Hansschlegelia quercus]|uniref:N-acetyltransferase n=1 Tax=Hansschlegelia quercus TaxID=2528245 RepID=A0A4Q9GJ49_9HYPH|nr:GNAT family N-acetyltransferase [Hansschlegelia quercus]TBN54132.1 N-acetyltransferase [Hansschlegelia quercus]